MGIVLKKFFVLFGCVMLLVNGATACTKDAKKIQFLEKISTLNLLQAVKIRHTKYGLDQLEVMNASSTKTVTYL